MTLKKALVAITVVAMLFGMVGTAFAGAAFKDVDGTKYADASARLAALSILKGYEDGSFKPDGKITRAEFAAVAVRALGLDSAAGYSKVDTQFSDVKGDHWAAGYINVAVDQGLLKGYPDGTFKPENNVTYAEALAILVRVLGYEPAVKGNWPTNYVVKAADIGISKNVSFGANAPATRGDVAVFTDNSLEKSMMIQVGFGQDTRYEVSNANNGGVKNLLVDKIGATKIAEAAVGTNTPRLSGGNLKSDQIKIGATTYTVLGNINPDAYAGLSVEAFEKDDKIVAIKIKTDADKIITGTVDSIDADGKIVLTDDRKFSVDGAVVVKLNLADSAVGNNAASPIKGAAVKLVLNADGKVAFVEAFKDEDSVIVSKIDDANKNIVTYDWDVDSTANTSYKDKTVVVEKNGARVGGVEALKADNVIRIFNIGGANPYLYIIANDAKVTGDFTAVSAKATIAGSKLTIGGTAYTIGGKNDAGTVKASYSFDKNDTSAKLEDLTKLGSALSKSVTVFLNTQGKIRHLVTDVQATNDVTGVVLVAPVGEGAVTITYKVKVFKLDGTKVVYEFKDSDAYKTTLDAGNNQIYKVGDVVKVSLNSDGKVTKMALTGTSGSNVTNKDKDNNTLTISGTTYRVNSNTVYINNGNSNASTDPKVINASDVLSYDFATTNQVAVVKATDGVLSWVVFPNNVTFTSSETSGVVVANGLNADGDWTVTFNVKGTTSTYTNKSSAVGSSVYATGTLVSFTLSGSEAKSLTSRTAVYSGAVQAIDTANNMIKAGDIWYSLTSSTALYDTSDTVTTTTLANLATNYTVDIFKDNKGLVDVIVVTAH